LVNTVLGQTVSSKWFMIKSSPFYIGVEGKILYPMVGLNVFSTTNMNDNKRKIALVTGGNRGLARQTRQLLELD
jgi:hypothetical protein